MIFNVTHADYKSTFRGITRQSAKIKDLCPSWSQFWNNHIFSLSLISYQPYHSSRRLFAQSKELFGLFFNAFSNYFLVLWKGYWCFCSLLLNVHFLSASNMELPKTLNYRILIWRINVSCFDCWFTELGYRKTTPVINPRLIAVIIGWLDLTCYILFWPLDSTWIRV